MSQYSPKDARMQPRLPRFATYLAALVVLPLTLRGEEVSLKQLSGAPIDSKWFRYVNLRFGLAVDIPTRGYRYDVPENGSGLTLTSTNGLVTITAHAHWVDSSNIDKPKDVRRPIEKMFDDAVAETLQKEGTVDCGLRKEDFYVISGVFGSNTYYERLTISAECPAVFNSVRIFYPTALQKRLDGLVMRISRSLRATCRGFDNLP